ncbi:MAG TPA: bifunctional hydroxymethylpyrimidine kinase/phosphomethylpyrimidine kinase [Polyangiales bacterium]|nr:bifunctional hydroxymethylpyrimidine kinase/phosphomethylpyrimidine kinase [Polyangiales bacterium]
MTAIALTIAGSDPSGGAGIQADLKSFHAHGVYGMAALALLTVQNTRGVFGSQLVTPDILAAQVRAIFEDAPPHAIKTGALGGPAQVEIVAEVLSELGAGRPLVIDPVCVSKSGASLLDESGRQAMLKRLVPLATLVTPNLEEAAWLLGRSLRTEAEITDAGRAFVELGASAALIKGGHREGDAIDVLCTREGSIALHAPRIETRNTHGVGCSLSAAIAARLALGEPLAEACRLAKRWISAAIASAPNLGSGHGPVNHFAPVPVRE